MKLTVQQLNRMIEMDGQKLKTTNGTARNPIVVRFARWTKADRDRVYINIVSGGGLARDLGNSAGYIDLHTGDVLGDNWHKWAQGVREDIVDQALAL